MRCLHPVPSTKYQPARMIPPPPSPRSPRCWATSVPAAQVSWACVWRVLSPSNHGANHEPGTTHIVFVGHWLPHHATGPAVPPDDIVLSSDASSGSGGYRRRAGRRRVIVARLGTGGWWRAWRWAPVACLGAGAGAVRDRARDQTCRVILPVGPAQQWSPGVSGWRNAIRKTQADACTATAGRCLHRNRGPAHTRLAHNRKHPPSTQPASLHRCTLPGSGLPQRRVALSRPQPAPIVHARLP